jgi:Nucleotidyltransferase of unknown function (DUF6036)
MDKHEIEAYLIELDEALAAAFPSPEPMRVLVVGGACLLLADASTRTTKDIDVIITDLEGQGEASLVYQLTKTTKRIRQIIAAIGKQHRLPAKERMFFNDDCALFLQDMGPLPQARLFQAYRKLHVYLPVDLGYILACKLMAGRPGKDYDDIRVLRKRLGIRTRAQAQALVNKFFPDPYDQELHQLAATLTEVLGEQ